MNFNNKNQKNFQKNPYIIELKDINAFKEFYKNINSFVFDKQINVIFLDDIASLIETEFINQYNNVDWAMKKMFLKE